MVLGITGDFTETEKQLQQGYKAPEYEPQLGLLCAWLH